MEADSLLVDVTQQAFSGRRVQMQADLEACCLLP